MVFFKLVIRFILISFLVLGLLKAGHSQSCSGITGGVLGIRLGLKCANLDAVIGPLTGGEISMQALNVPLGTSTVSFRVIWDDGTFSLTSATQNMGTPTTWEVPSLVHRFPTTGPDVKCEYNPRVLLYVNGNLCNPNFGSPPKFNRWNVDNENSGILDLSESVTSANTYFVCKGNEATVTFTDRSTLNCVPPGYVDIDPFKQNENSLQRWRRFTYGTVSTITSTTGVEVDGTIETYPFQGLIISEDPSLTPITSTITLPVKIPADAQVGEEFEITMEYWNTCNPFPGTPVTQTARIVIIDLPNQPLVDDNEICFGDVGTSILPITNIQPNVTYKWYATFAEADAQTVGTELYTGDTFTPTTLQASTGVNHYFVRGTWGTNSCASPIEEVLLAVREDLNTVPPLSWEITHSDVCPNTTYTYRVSADPAVELIGGATEYVWSTFTASSADGVITIVSGQGTREITLQTNAFSGPFILNVQRSYVSVPQCPSTSLSQQITTHANPSPNITMIPSNGNICEGETTVLNGNPNNPFGNPFSHSWTGTDVNLVLDNLAIENPSILITAPARSYNFTYTFINSIGCSGNDDIDITITPRPLNVDAGLDQNNLCFDILLPLITTLAAATPSAGMGTWSYVSGPDNTPFFSNEHSTNSTVEVNQPGIYVFQWEVVDGPCSVTSTVQIDFGRTPNQPTSSLPLSFCGFTGTVSGSAPTFETGTWSKISGSGNILFDDIHLPTATVTADAYGQYQLKWEFTSGSGTGLCSPKFALVDVKFSEPATATVPADFTFCVDQTLLTPIDLTGTNLVGGGATEGRWQVVSGLGVIQSSGSATGASVTNATSFLDHYIPVAGETTMTLQMVAQHPDAGVPCSNVNSPDLNITIDLKPADAFAGDDFSVCDGTPAVLGATAADNDGSGAWSYFSGPDIAPVFDDVANPVSDVSVNLAGDYIYKWTVKSLLDGMPGACVADDDDVNVTVRALPEITNILANVCQTELLVPEAHGIVLSDYDNEVITPAVTADRTVKWYLTSDDRDNDVSPITLPTDLSITDNIRYTRVVDTTIPTQLCSSLGEAIFTIKPNITINAVTDKTEICSGETITVISSTLGGTEHRWFYRESNNPSVEFDLRGPTASPTTQRFVIANTSSVVVPYEIIYQVTNGFCPKEMVLPLTVYPAINAGFDTISVTKYIGGNAFANFVNTSVPLDGNVFRYDWDFGNDAVPQTFSGVSPPQIRYTSLGGKTIQLTVTNIVAEANGLSCAGSAYMNISIELARIDAAFSYTPQTMCFPAEISITENLGTGDLYEWKLREIDSATPLLESNLNLPVFKINSPGFYVIEFKTTNSITGQHAEANNSATPIEIFDKPFASFELRTKTVYVPDEELIITNRSTDASQYEWDFGDGEKSDVTEPNHAYGLAGEYWLALVAGFNHGATDTDGDGVTDGDLICYDTARQKITAKDGGITRVPNAFTPSTAGPNGGVSSGGSFNDVFKPITKGVEEFEMQIYDRWGNLVFESKDKNIGWDGYNRTGQLLPAGVYVYKLTMRLSNNQRTTQVGDVTLIR